eukprot:scaffold53_cov381-Pavlova_lutheri.AAC.8
MLSEGVCDPHVPARTRRRRFCRHAAIVPSSRSSLVRSAALFARTLPVSVVGTAPGPNFTSDRIRSVDRTRPGNHPVRSGLDRRGI